VGYSIYMHNIYENNQFAGLPDQGPSPISVVQKYRSHVVVEYGYIMAATLLFISVIFAYVSKKLWGLFNNNRFLKLDEFRDQRNYLRILQVVFSISFAFRVVY
jgi:hypothetical protein